MASASAMTSARDDGGELARRLQAASCCVWQWVDGQTDRSRVVFGGTAGLVVIDPDEEPTRAARVFENAGDVRNVAITPDGRRAVVGTSDGVYRLWDLEEGRAMRRCSLRDGVPGRRERRSTYTSCALCSWHLMLSDSASKNGAEAVGVSHDARLPPTTREVATMAT